MLPPEDLTNSQRRLLSQFLTLKRETKSNVREPIWFALVLAGEKPGCLISTNQSVEDDSIISFSLKEMIEEFDLVYSDLGGSLDVARFSWRIEMLPSNHHDLGPEACLRRAGAFYGYPKEDVKHFIDAGPWETYPTDLVEAGTIRPEAAAYMMLLPQRYDVAEHYDRAIESGKRIRKTMSEQSEQWDLKELDDYADWIYQTALERATP